VVPAYFQLALTDFHNPGENDLERIFLTYLYDGTLNIAKRTGIGTEALHRLASHHEYVFGDEFITTGWINRLVK